MSIGRLFFRIVFVFFVFALVKFSGCVQSINSPPDAVVIPAPVETPAIGGVDKPPDAVVSPAPVEPQETKGSDDFDLVITSNPATPELDEADLSTTHIFQISLDKKPSENVTILIKGPNPNPAQLDFSIEGNHKVHPVVGTPSLPPFYSFDFTPENWNVPRTITAQIKNDNNEDQGSSYVLLVSITAKKKSVAEFSDSIRNRFLKYPVTIRDNDRPGAPQTLRAFACNGSNYLYWRGNCTTEGCFAGETSEYEIFYSLATDSVSESSPSFRLTLDQLKPPAVSSFFQNNNDKILTIVIGSNPSDFARTIRTYSHTSLTNGTQVFYKIRLNRINDRGNITESSILSDVVIANPTISNDHAVFCPENGDGTAASPFRIKTGTHLQEVQYYRFAFFRLENDITMADNFSTIGTDFFGFRGQLDGQGNTITHVKRAIFEKLIQPGEVRNLHLEANVDEELVKNYCSLRQLGILLNYNVSGKVERVYSTGSATYTVDGQGFGDDCFLASYIRPVSIGGLVGANWDKGIVQESFSTVQITVQGKSGSEPITILNLGGLVGENNGMLLNSFSTSTLSVDEVSLNPNGRETNYVSNVGGVLGLNPTIGILGFDTGRGVIDTVFHALGMLAVPKVSGGGAFSHTALGEDARLNSATTGGNWGNTTIWNLGSDSEYPCLIGLPDIANNPSDASIVCAVP